MSTTDTQYTINPNADDVNAVGNITSQTTFQRDKFRDSLGRGASSVSVNNLFNNAPSSSEILNAAYNNMLQLYRVGIYTGTNDYLNPDFGVNSLTTGQLGYDNIRSFVVGVDNNQADKPALGIGPNLKSGSLTDSGLPQYPDRFENDTVAANNRGFGMSVTTNNIEYATVGSYLRRSLGSNNDNGINASQRPQLGEAIDHSDISYSS